MGRDSLLEFHAQPLGCVHAWGAARARHARIRLRNGPFRTIPDSLRSPQGFEMSCAAPSPFLDRRKSGHIHPAPTYVGAPKDGSPRRRAIAARIARRLCAPAASAPSPFLDSRKSAASTARANVCASFLVTRYRKVGIQPAPSRHRSPTRSRTVRGFPHGPITDSRQSKIGRVDRPRQCVWPSILVTGYRKVGIQPAPSRHRSLTRSRTVRGCPHSPITDSRQSKIGRVDCPRLATCGLGSILVTGY
jgi:hypothetical protein